MLLGGRFAGLASKTYLDRQLMQASKHVCDSTVVVLEVDPPVYSFVLLPAEPLQSLPVAQGVFMWPESCSGLHWLPHCSWTAFRALLRRLGTERLASPLTPAQVPWAAWASSSSPHL